jgi:hypothetical protein
VVTILDVLAVLLFCIFTPGHSYRADKYQYGDDNIRIQLVVQTTDAVNNTAGSRQTISVGAKAGTPTIFRSMQVQIGRTLTEVADIVVTPTLNNVSG